MLRHCASFPEKSRGRRFPCRPAPARNDFERDRDRIVHSTGFRRLAYKTQVFLNHEGDLFRTRMTHSIEVAQLARSIARSLRLNEDLCEAISLAHDLGHTPFGHAGQEILNDCLRQAFPDSAGFEHNYQSLRVVDVLERRYPYHDGLNLTFESREGILKHCSRRHALELESIEPGGVGSRFIRGTQPSLEAQICNLADEIAYNAHDIDDGVRSGLLVYEQLLELPLWKRVHAEALTEFPSLVGQRLLYETIRRVLSMQVHDVIEASDSLLRQHESTDAEQVRQGPALIVCSPDMAADSARVKAFLRERLYRHPKVVATTENAKVIVRQLFEIYVADPNQIASSAKPQERPEVAIADYLAGMTDRFATSEHARLTGRIQGAVATAGR
jgi:dGTPase